MLSSYFKPFKENQSIRKRNLTPRIDYWICCCFSYSFTHLYLDFWYFVYPFSIISFTLQYFLDPFKKVENIRKQDLIPLIHYWICFAASLCVLFIHTFICTQFSLQSTIICCVYVSSLRASRRIMMLENLINPTIGHFVSSCIYYFFVSPVLFQYSRTYEEVSYQKSLCSRLSDTFSLFIHSH